MTAVVVRERPNVDAGQNMDVFFHAWPFPLLLAVLLIHSRNQIPYAALAVILLITGYKLTRPKLYKICGAWAETIHAFHADHCGDPADRPVDRCLYRSVNVGLLYYRITSGQNTVFRKPGSMKRTYIIFASTAT